MNLDDMLADLAKFKESNPLPPPVFLLCGERAYATLKKDVEALYTTCEEPPVVFGLRVVVSKLVDPDYCKLLPEPSLFRLVGVNTPPVPGTTDQEAT
tara:strand:+ start:187 stop:477 length:291 start_codon:yes stop_codon:yes gene_type:complete